MTRGTLCCPPSWPPCLHPGAERTMRDGEHLRRIEPETAGAVGAIIVVAHKQISVSRLRECLQQRGCRRRPRELHDIQMLATHRCAVREKRAHGEFADVDADFPRRRADGRFDFLAAQMFSKCGQEIRKPARHQKPRRMPISRPDRIANDVAPQARTTAGNERVIDAGFGVSKPVPRRLLRLHLLDRNKFVEQAVVDDHAQPIAGTAVGDRKEALARRVHFPRFGVAARKQRIELAPVGRKIDAAVHQQFEVREHTVQPPLRFRAQYQEQPLEEQRQPAWRPTDDADVLIQHCPRQSLDLQPTIGDQRKFEAAENYKRGPSAASRSRRYR